VSTTAARPRATHRVAVVTALGLLCTVLAPARADIFRGVAAFEQGDFVTAMAELEPLAQPLGQERALEAIEFGVDIDQHGFNLFLIGEPGFGKNELVHQILSRHAEGRDSRSDWCYVNNFDNPQKPGILKLPSGMGAKLRRDMESLVEDLLTSLPSSPAATKRANARPRFSTGIALPVPSSCPASG